MAVRKPGQLKHTTVQNAVLTGPPPVALTVYVKPGEAACDALGGE